MPKAKIRQRTLLEFSDPKFEPPTPEEVRAMLTALDFTGSQAAQLVGVDGRTIRKWTGGERSIPYAAWRLLVLEYEETRGNQ